LHELPDTTPDKDPSPHREMSSIKEGVKGVYNILTQLNSHKTTVIGKKV
jgi:hypothetical protein